MQNKDLIMHETNIVIHVLSGTVALLLGIIALLSVKGSKIHNMSGRYFFEVGVKGAGGFGNSNFKWISRSVCLWQKHILISYYNIERICGLLRISDLKNQVEYSKKN